MASASSKLILLGGLATAAIVGGAATGGATVPEPGSPAVAPLPPAVPVVAPARLLPLYECDVETENWEVAWTPDWKAWCCENDDSKRGCPPTTSVTTTTVTTTKGEETTTGEEAASKSCGSSCTVAGATFSCSARIRWASAHTFKAKESPCDAAVDLVHSECDACSKCTVEASGCSAAKGEDEGAQEEQAEAHPEPAEGVTSEKDEQETPEAKEQQGGALESKEETKAEVEKSADDKDKSVDTDAPKDVDLGPQIGAREEAQGGSHGQARSDASKDPERTELSVQRAQASAPSTVNLRKALAEKFEEPVSRLGMLSSPSASSASPRSSRILDGLWMALMGGVAFAVATSTYQFVGRRRAAVERELMGAGGAAQEFLQDEEGGADDVQE